VTVEFSGSGVGGGNGVFCGVLVGVDVDTAGTLQAVKRNAKLSRAEKIKDFFDNFSPFEFW